MFKVKSLGFTEYLGKDNKVVVISNETILAMADQIRSSVAGEIPNEQE